MMHGHVQAMEGWGKPGICKTCTVIRKEAFVQSVAGILVCQVPTRMPAPLYCTAIVTVLEVTPPMLRITGTAEPVGVPVGTWTFT